MDKNIKKIAYQKYQLDWMMKHGWGINDLIQLLGEYERELWEFGGLPGNCDEIFSDWELEVGFKGNLWVCFDEFIGAEYQNRVYMEQLLTKGEFELWKKDVGCRDTTRREMRNLSNGDLFIIDGNEYVASGDAYEIENDGEYVVYDENGDGWFESDFMD